MGSKSPYLVHAGTWNDDLHTTFAVDLPRDYHSYNSRPYDQTDGIHFPSKARSKDWSSEAQHRGAGTAVNCALKKALKLVTLRISNSKENSSN